MKHLGKLCLAVVFAGLAAMPVAAQEWPARTVTILVPYPAGGVADAVARAVATQATTELKQSFVVENRTGASGRIALDQLIRAEPDGYTLALAVPALLSLLPITDAKYADLDKKFTPITIAVETYFGLAINPQKTPAQNFQELMRSTKARSGQLTYSSAGAGTSYHFWSEAILKEAGINALHVPYRGEAPATTDLLAGIVDFTLVTGAGKGLADDGKASLGSGVVALIGVSDDGKASAVVAVTEDLIGRFSAVELVRIASAALGGKGGGGRPDMAQAGGPDGSKAADAIDAVAAALNG